MKKLVLISLGVVVLFVGTVVWKVTRHEPEEGTIKIGTVLPLSGPLAFMGEGTLNGLRLAEEHANTKKWGELAFQIQILAEDGGGIPKTSIGAYQKLVSASGAKIIITTLSGPSMALKSLAEEQGVLLFANASHPQITVRARTTLRHSNVASQEAELFVRSMKGKGIQKGVAIIVNNDDYGVAFAEAMEDQLKQAQVDVLANVKYEREGFDARVLAQQIVAKKPDAAVVVGVGKNLGLLIRRLREYNFEGHVYASLGFVLVPGAVQAAGETAKGVRHTRFVFETQDPAYREITTEYKMRFGHELGAEALIAYNTVRLLCTAIRDAGRDATTLAKHISAMGRFEGVGEHMRITQSGDILPALEVVTFGE